MKVCGSSILVSVKIFELSVEKVFKIIKWQVDGQFLTYADKSVSLQKIIYFRWFRFIFFSRSIRSFVWFNIVLI